MNNEKRRFFERKSYVKHYESLLEDIIKKSNSQSLSTFDAANALINDYQSNIKSNIISLSLNNYEWLRYMISFDTKTEEQFSRTNYSFENDASLVLKRTQKNIGIDVKLAALMAKHNGEVDWNETPPKVILKLSAEATYDGKEYKINDRSYKTWRDADDALSKIGSPTTPPASTITAP